MMKAVEKTQVIMWQNFGASKNEIIGFVLYCLLLFIWNKHQISTETMCYDCIGYKRLEHNI